jgi:protocatechuate 3,4-dioxygenase beta subunit
MERRVFLGAAAAVVLAACSDGGDDASDTTTTAVPRSPGTRLTVDDFADADTCTLLPEKTAGPFPLEEQFDRDDITEGMAGHHLRLGLRVVDAACAALPGAAVEVWHADPSGDYSAFIDEGGGKDEGEGTSFLRGTQRVNDDGIVEFTTVYPGWYTGRAVHIHLRVHVDDEIVATSQLFFDEAVTEQVYTQEPYAEFGLPDTSNADDSIAGDPEAEGTLLTLRPADAGTEALLQISVDV